MNNRSFDGIAIIICFALTLAAAWIESSAFTMSDRLAFVVLSGFAVLWLISTVYAKVSAPVAQVAPQVLDRQPAPAEVSTGFIAEIKEFEAQLDAQIAEIEARNPAMMTEVELFHKLADIASQPEVTQPEEVQPIVQVVPPIEEVKPKKTRSRAAAKTKSSAAATVTVKAEGDTKVEPAVKAKKTRSTTTKKTATSSKSRSSKKSGDG